MTECRNDYEREGYLAWHADADRRAKRGEKQRQCPDCKRWYWPNKPSEVAMHPRIAAALGRAGGGR